MMPEECDEPLGYLAEKGRLAARHPRLTAGLVVALALLVNTIEVLNESEHVSVIEFILDTVEKSLLFVGAGGVLLLLGQIRRGQIEQKQLFRQLEVARVEGSAWRGQVQSLTDGLGVEIERQFGKWNLTDAEREVGQLMIKGLSHKEVAGLRGTSEATVRQQARAIYQKCGLPGKAAFSAYFLEDLLPPAARRSSQ